MAQNRPNTSRRMITSLVWPPERLPDRLANSALGTAELQQPRCVLAKIFIESLLHPRPVASDVVVIADQNAAGPDERPPGMDVRQNNRVVVAAVEMDHVQRDAVPGQDTRRVERIQ